MKKSELKKLIREAIKEQIHSAASHYYNTHTLPLLFTNRVDNYGCGKLSNTLAKLDNKMNNLQAFQSLPNFSSGVNPRWYALLQAKRHYVNNLMSVNCTWGGSSTGWIAI